MTDNTILPQNVRISDQVLFQEIEGESVLLNLKTELYYGLDEVGTRFWQLLGEGTNIPSVVASLLDEYEVGEETLRLDLASLINELRRQGLVIVEE